MRICIACPAPARSRLGNRVTALRWSRLFRALGHPTRIVEALDDRPCDLVIALHARRSADSVRRSKESTPDRPVIVALTGTDLYRDIHCDEDAKRSLDLAERLVVLHDLAVGELPRALRRKAVVIMQSASRPARRSRRSSTFFDVAVVGHLRPEKDPFRTAEAARLLPPRSRVRVLHAGHALSEAMARRARAEMAANPRYHWLGGVPPGRARALIARSHVLALTSELEGGANVLGEAVMAGTPILATRIAATEAQLGRGYPGLFPVGDTRALEKLISRAEDDASFLAALRRLTCARRGFFSPAAESRAWRRLLAAL